MEWTDIRLTVAKADAENAEAVATMIAEGGIYIEDYSDIEQPWPNASFCAILLLLYHKNKSFCRILNGCFV